MSRFLELQNDETKHITRTIINDDEETVLLVHKPLHEDAGIHGNIALAAMTTAYARIALYKVSKEALCANASPALAQSINTCI